MKTPLHTALFVMLLALLTGACNLDSTPTPRLDAGDGDAPGDGDGDAPGNGDTPGDGDGDAPGDGDGDAPGDGDGDAPGDGDAQGDGDGDVSDAGIDAGDAGGDDGVRVIRGRAIRARDLKPRAQVRVRAGDASVLADAQGFFSIEVPSQVRGVNVWADGIASQYKQLPDGGQDVFFDVVTQDVLVSRALDPVSGTTVKTVVGASVKFDPGALDVPLMPMSMTAQAKLTPVDPQREGERRAFPGEFAVSRGDGTALLSATSAMDITVDGQDGKLDIAVGKRALVRFPVYEDAPPQVRELFSFDESQRVWRSEGTAQLRRDSSGKRVYEAQLTHLSWWAVGDAVEDTSCLRACVQDADGVAVDAALVSLSGVDHNGETSVYTGDDGCFAVDVKAAAEVRIEVEAEAGTAAPGVFDTPEPGMSADDAPDSCLDLGTFSLTPRPMDATCPPGKVECGDACVDTRANVAHCGGCDDACALGGQVCAEGSCRCGRSQTLCGGTECVRTANDADHCGVCGNACNPGQVCEAGACVELACATGETDCEGVCVDLAVDGVDGSCPDPDGEGCGAGLTQCGVECVSLASDAAHCGTCNNVCVGSEQCIDGTCTTPLQCETGFGDCGGQCTDLQADVGNCGVCDLVCAFDNAAASCEAGVCTMGACQGGFVDLDGIAGTGCEYPCTPDGEELCDTVDNDCDGNVDEDDPLLGSACGNGEGRCVQGTTECVDGGLECSGGTGPGMEVCDNFDNDCDGNTDEDDPALGDACGNGEGLCVQGTNVCVDGALECVDGTGPAPEVCDNFDNDCDGNTDEDDPLLGTACGNGTGECEQGVYTCSGGALSCVGEVTGGPEVCDTVDNDCDGNTDETFDTDTDVTHCGTCNNACIVENGSPECVLGNCQVASCVAGFDDCDGSAGNGCEENLAVSVAHCGGCGNDCDAIANTSSTTCTAGSCTIEACTAPYDDCNGSLDDGCETSLHTIGNCGGCDRLCAFDNAFGECGTGVCNFAGCQAGAFDCNGTIDDGCETVPQAEVPDVNENTAVAYPLGFIDGQARLVRGSTAGYRSDFTMAQLGCGTERDTPDAVVSFEVESPTQVRLDATASPITARVSLLDVDLQLLGCRVNDLVDIALSPGQYYVVITGATVNDAGPYDLSVLDLQRCKP